jgi:hypothetical protein
MINDFLSSSLSENVDLYLKIIAQCNIYTLNQIKDAVNVLVSNKSDVMTFLSNNDKQNSRLLSMVHENCEKSHGFSERIELIEKKIDTLLSEKCDRYKLLKFMDEIYKSIQEIKDQDVSKNKKKLHDLEIVESCKNTYYSGNIIGTAKSSCKLCSVQVLRNAHYFKTVAGDTICYKCGKDVSHK